MAPGGVFFVGRGARINEQLIKLSTNYQRSVHQRISNSNTQRLFVELRVGADEAEDDEPVANFLVQGTHVAGDVYTVVVAVLTSQTV